MDYRQLAYQTAQKYGIDPDLFVRQIQAESAFRPDAVSSAGAIGLGQLMPATAKELGVDPNDPVQNLEGAARYMKQQLDRFGDPALALAAYNAGPSRVAKAGGVPNITETQNYVAKILGGKGGAAMAQQPQQQPQGLLGGLLGGQGIGGALGLSDDLRDRIAMGIMAGSNPRQFAPLIQQRAASMQDRRDKRDAQATANITASYIESLGDKKLAELVRGGGISGAEALTAITKSDKKFVDIEKYKLAQAQGYDGTFIDFTKDLAQIEKTGEVPAGLEAMNKKFGEELIDLDLVGLGEARFRTAKIKTVLDQLEAGEDLTGPLLSVIGELGRSIYNPKSQQAKDLVESVIQTSLRETLGGQFAQKEGEALIKRAYNIALPPEENAARLRALLAQLEASAASKTAMAEYYRENNFSLAGYKGSKYTPTVEDLYSAIDAASAEFKSGGVETPQAAPAAASNVTHIYNPQTGKVEPVK